MKKLLTLLIVAALAVSMVACSAPKESSSVESTPSVSESSPESSEAPDESLEAPVEFDIPEENQKLGDIINASRPAEFNEYNPAVLSKDDPNAEMLAEVMGINYDDMKAFAFSTSAMMTQAYSVGIFQPAEGKDEAVLKSVNGFVEKQQKAFEQYLADQKEIADAATVDVLDDGTIVLVMSEGGEAIQKAILEALKK